jgi:hypothetical protein
MSSAESEGSALKSRTAVGVGKIIFLLGEIVVLGDNLGAKTANACLSTETKITCSHVFVDEILGTWRARSPPKNRQLVVSTSPEEGLVASHLSHCRGTVEN